MRSDFKKMREVEREAVSSFEIGRGLLLYEKVLYVETGNSEGKWEW